MPMTSKSSDLDRGVSRYEMTEKDWPSVLEGGLERLRLAAIWIVVEHDRHLTSP